jgi:hypothetical protein
VGGQWRAEVQTEEKAQELDSRSVHVVNEQPVEMGSLNVGQDGRHV